MTVLEDFSLTGLRAVATGGGNGIGQGITLCLTKAGADVMVSARTQSDLDVVTAETTAPDIDAMATPPMSPHLGSLMRIPLGRIGAERDIGGAVVFPAPPAASWITGQVLLVTGGR
jgi:NAD(P)-dependent dehydrogenase (short-subunit alcohol dehydrogenase family)